MFSSSSSGDPFSYPNDTASFRHSSTAIERNRGSSQEEEAPLPPQPPLFLHFPSPFLDNGDAILDQPVPQQDKVMNDAGLYINADIITSPAATEQRTSKGRPRKRSDGATNPNPRRRTGKKDRHSKICTAHGLRDRRMRLSVQVARKFFDLQDMLHFDKASKTIEWLLSQSKCAIKELTRNLPQMHNNGGGSSSSRKSTTASSMSECEDASVMEESVHRETLIGFGVPDVKKKMKLGKSSAIDLHVKESRDKARARARERTRERMLIRSLEKSKQKQCLDENPNYTPRSFETADESCSHSHEKSSPLEVAANVEEPSPHSLEHQFSNADILESFLGAANSSASRSILDFQNNPVIVSDGEDDSNNTFMAILGNWNVDSTRISSNYGAWATMVPMAGNIHEQNPISNSPSSHFHSQFFGNHFHGKW
ncbi:hypothetical protein U1Q18_002407 [Sarracenia purpurea var. burkii]